MIGSAISLLFFSNTVARGGVEEHMLTLLRGLDRKTFRLCLACPPVLAEALRPDLPPDVQLEPVCLRKPTHFSEALRLARILLARRVDILHSHLFYSSLFASPLGKLCGVPLIVETPHVREQWRRGWLKRHFWIDRAAGRAVDRYIAVSEANARYLAERKRLPAGKITVIRNGCDTQRFEPHLAELPGLRQSLGFAERDPVVVVPGRLEPQKGHEVLLAALPEVVAAFPRLRVVIVGDGSLGRVLQEKTHALGLGGTVRFAGFQHNMMDWYALADFTVLASFYEGLPLVAIESLAAGKPVIATAVDGTPEVVVDGQTGITVPAGDPSSLAKAMCGLLGNAPLRVRLGGAGRDWVCARYDQRLQIQRMDEFYQSALEQRLARSQVTRFRQWRHEGS